MRPRPILMCNFQRAEQLFDDASPSDVRFVDNVRVYCWGQRPRNRFNRLSTPFSNVPVSVVNLTSSNVTSIEMGYHSTCTLHQDGTVKCWGRADGALGRTGSLTSGVYYDTPESIAVLPFGRTVTQLSLGSNHACIRLQDGSIQCYGMDDDRQLGNNFGTNEGNYRGWISEETHAIQSSSISELTENVPVVLVNIDLSDFADNSVQISIDIPQGMTFFASNQR